METKKCTKCGEWKDISEFYKRQKGKNGYNSQCKECKKKYEQELTQVYQQENISLISEKRCSKCGELKELVEFHKQKRSKDGHKGQCKKCRNIGRQETIKGNKKLCTKCGEWKEFTYFGKQKSHKDGHQSHCKECKKKYCQENKEYYQEYNKKYKQDNKEETSRYNKKYKQDNKEQISKISKVYRDNNKNKINEYYNSSIKFNSELKDRQEIELYEKVRESINGNVEVKCAYCNDWFEPSYRNIRHRVTSINNINQGERRLYCSEGCKKACPSFHQRLYFRDQKEATSREVQPELRKMVLERDKFTCQKCKKHKNELEEGIGLHCHHLEGVQWEPLMSADIHMCITLCAECHKEVHKIEGCTYHDMQCNK